LGDFMVIFACRCISAGCWQLENPPQTANHWVRIVRLARKNRSEFVSLTPKAAAILHGQQRN
jgi:hypothetical protein